MRWILTLALLVLPVLASAQDATALKTDKEKLSYAMGMDLGAQLKSQVRGQLTPTSSPAASKTRWRAAKTLLTDDEAKTRHRRAAEDDAGQAGGGGQGRGREEHEGRRRVPGGQQGEGRRRHARERRPVQGPLARHRQSSRPLDDTVVCQYRGTLIDGKEFDSSYKRGQPATFPVKGVIKGWTEVLQLMPVGSKWQVVIPPALAYGERGAGADIGPNATLIFEIELVAIK